MIRWTPAEMHAARRAYRAALRRNPSLRSRPVRFVHARSAEGRRLLARVNPPQTADHGFLERIGHQTEVRYRRKPGESAFPGGWFHRETGTARQDFAIPDGATLTTAQGRVPVGGGILTLDRAPRYTRTQGAPSA